MTVQHIPDLLALLPEVPPDTIISRTFTNGEELKGILFGFAAGQSLSEHTSARPAILHFLTGEADVTAGEARLMARPGTWLHLPPKMPHSNTAQTPVTMLLLLL